MYTTILQGLPVTIIKTIWKLFKKNLNPDLVRTQICGSFTEPHTSYEYRYIQL